MTLYQLGERMIGEIREIPGERHHPFIQWGFQLCAWDPETPDETPWCSTFINSLCWLQRLPRSKSAAARSWLQVGQRVPLSDAEVGYDVVVLSRGANPRAGHVGLYSGHLGDEVEILGGNQSNAVTVQSFALDRLLGVRRMQRWGIE